MVVNGRQFFFIRQRCCRQRQKVVPMFRRSPAALWLCTALFAWLTLTACNSAPTKPAATSVPATATPMPSATVDAPPTVAPLPTWTPIPTPRPGVLHVDATVDLGSINPAVYGTNFGPWVALRPETLPLAETAGVTVLRYPGGAWGDQNDLQAYQIDQFVDLARKMGAEPYIHVRFLDSSPGIAAGIVQYTNVVNDYDIRYWSIGNEPSLYEAEGEPWNAADFAAEWRRFALSMRAVDPDILLVGPETHQFNGTPNVDPQDSTGADWLRTFLDVNGDLVDIVSVHRYPFPNNARRTSALAEELLANSAEWSQIPRNLRRVVRETTGRDLPIAITEFNSHWSNSIGGATTPDSFLSALWLGDVLGRLIQERVELANQFLLVSGGESGFGLLARTEPRPAYYVYQLYKQFGDQMVYASADAPGVSIYAAQRSVDDALTLMTVNLTDEAVTIPLQLNGFTPAGDAQVWRFDAAHQAEQIADQPLADGTEIALPPQSMTLFVVNEE